MLSQIATAVGKEGDAKAEGRALFASILRPILRAVSTPSLIVVPDGSLHRVPFAGLADDQNRYLIETRTISYAPSGTVFALLRSRTPAVPRELLAVGDVDYGRGFRSIAASFIFRGVRDLRRDALWVCRVPGMKCKPFDPRSET